MSNALSVITKQLSKESDPAFLEFTARIVESIELVLGYEPTVGKCSPNPIDIKTVTSST